MTAIHWGNKMASLRPMNCVSCFGVMEFFSELSMRPRGIIFARLVDVSRMAFSLMGAELIVQIPF